MELDVGVRDAVAAAQEGPGVGLVARAHALLEEEPLEADHDHAVRLQVAVERDRLLAAVLHVNLQMVVQVLADARQVDRRRDADRAQVIGRTDAGEHQELRRAEGAGADDHLARGEGLAGLAAHGVGQAEGPPLVEQHPLAERAGPDGQRGVRRDTPQVGPGRGGAQAALDVHVEAAEALLPRAVDVAGRREAGLAAGLEEGPAERVELGLAADPDRPLAAAVAVGAGRESLQALEVGQHLVVAPAAAAALGPALVVQRVAAQVDHAVDRGGAAQGLAARLVERAAVEVLLRLGLQVPVVAAVALVVRAQAAGHADRPVTVLRPGLQQQDRGAAVGEAPGQDAAGRARARHDVVEGFPRH